MPTRPEAFLEPPSMSGPRPCVRSHLKKDLVPYSPVWWGAWPIAKISQLPLVAVVVFHSVESAWRGCRGSFTFTSRGAPFLGFRGPSNKALTLLGGARFFACCLRRPFWGKCRRGPRHFRSYPVYLHYRPAHGPTLIKALCQTRTVDVTNDKYGKYTK